MTTSIGPTYLGVDVGTGSARAGVFDARGVMLAAASEPIQLWRPQGDFVEQSSDDIWAACCRAVRAAIADADVAPAGVRGIGFDATCSLAAVDAHGRPVSISPTGRDEQNVVVWMDHRAIPQAARINATGHAVLRYVGGVISPEMQTPKLLWLRENLPATWRRAARFFDLPDYLTYRATGDDTRSLCTTVCKWTYLGREEQWDSSYFRQVGLGDLADEGFVRIGTRVRPMGEPVGGGLSAQAAAELGLNAGTAVGVGIIDAHAGGLGVIGAGLGDAEGSTSTDGVASLLERRLALIGGTSSCHMAVSGTARFIPGVWGPYWSAMIPGLWLTEGGQSATGALIDHIIHSHARGADLEAEARSARRSVYEILNDQLDRLAAAEGLQPVADSGPARRPAAELTRDLHVLPDFHGNRSPRADPTLRGAIVGLSLGDSIADLARLYLATIQAIAYGTRHIIESLNQRGYRIDTIMACGGGTKNPAFLREHADATGCAIVLPREKEAVLLGSAMLGAVASGDRPDVLSAMRTMSAAAETLRPAGGAAAAFHEAKYRVFHRLHEDAVAYRQMMSGAACDA